jgi:hypothetical protein
MTGVAGAWVSMNVALALLAGMALASLRGGRPGRSQPDAYALLRQEVLAKIPARNLDTSADPAPVGALVREAVADYQRQARTGLGVPPSPAPTRWPWACCAPSSPTGR